MGVLWYSINDSPFSEKEKTQYQIPGGDNVTTCLLNPTTKF